MANCSYFSHDCNARNDEKILALRMRHGAEGYAVFFMILERLRESVDYMSVRDYNVLAFDLRVSAELVKSVVEKFGLFAFSEDGKRFYSEGFTKRMKMKDDIQNAKSKAGKIGMEKRWGKSETTERKKTSTEEIQEPETVVSVPVGLPDSELHSDPEMLEILNDVVSFFRKKNPTMLGGLPQHLGKLVELYKLLRPMGTPKEMIRAAIQKLEVSAPYQNGKLDFSIDSFLKPDIFTRIYNGDFDHDFTSKRKRGVTKDAGTSFEDIPY